jgi:hypothetical protein
MPDLVNQSLRSQPFGALFCLGCSKMRRQGCRHHRTRGTHDCMSHGKLQNLKTSRAKVTAHLTTQPFGKAARRHSLANLSSWREPIEYHLLLPEDFSPYESDDVYELNKPMLTIS